MTLHELVASQDLEGLRAALGGSADVNALDGERRTPLIVAAGLGALEAVELLLSRGAEPGWRDLADETALLKAAANGHADVVARLLPLSSEDEGALAHAFLAAAGRADEAEAAGRDAGLRRGVASAAARAADALGYASPRERLERVERAEARQPGRKR